MMLEILKHFLARKFVFAYSALISLTLTAVYALHVHDSGAAMAAIGAVAAIGPVFIHSQRKSDEAGVK